MGFSPLNWFAGFATKSRVLFVSLAWLLGIVCGSVFAVLCGDTYYYFLRCASCQPATVLGLICTGILPLAILLVAIKLDARWLAMLVVFAKACFATACSVGIRFVYSNADWLVRIFVQFSDLLTLPVLCWLSLKSANNAISFTVLLSVFLWFVFVCLTDYFVISPFFVGLIVN